MGKDKHVSHANKSYKTPMKKLIFLLLISLALGCNQNRQAGDTGDNRKAETLKEANIKGCMKAILNTYPVDSVTAEEFCECSINRMFELYSYEEILKWGELSRTERMERENKINKECNHLLSPSEENR